MAPTSSSDISLVLRGWAAGEGPLHARLAAGLRAAVQRGDILPGTRLPPERRLAQALSVSRSTVVAAYGSLAKQGVLGRRQGSGTWVESVDRRAVGYAGELATRAQHKLLSFGSFDDGGTAINFLPATPPSVDAVRDLAAEAAAEVERISNHHGYWPLGYPPLRREIARRLSRRGLKTTEADILVTTGAQQAIALTALAFAGRGELAVLEDPTYPGAIDAYRQLGARILSVPVGPTGVDLDMLDDVLARAEARVIYVTPTNQNPTGTVMPKDARRRLVQLASTHGALIVEDDSVAEITLDGSPPLPVAAFADDGRVVSIGSMSKLFWGGLRVGWIRAPTSLHSHLARLKAIFDLGSAVPSQVLATLVLRGAEEIVPLRLAEVRSRRDVLASLVSTHLPSWSFAEPTGGLVLWARLPHGSASELADIARAKGVMILPGSMASASGRFDDHVRLPYVAEPDVLEEGVRRLARAWEAFTGDQPIGASEAGIVV